LKSQSIDISVFACFVSFVNLLLAEFFFLICFKPISHVLRNWSLRALVLRFEFGWQPDLDDIIYFENASSLSPKYEISKRNLVCKSSLKVDV